MKKIGLGIAVILYAILFKLCSSGLDIVALILGLVGMGITIFGCLDRQDS